MTDPRREMIGVAEAARRLGVSEKTVRRMVERGDLPHIRVGPQIRIAVTVFDELEAHARGEPNTAAPAAMTMDAGRRPR